MESKTIWLLSLGDYNSQLVLWGDKNYLYKNVFLGLPGGSVVEKPPAKAGDAGSIPGSGKSPGEGNGNPFRYSCLENPMYQGAWRVTAYGVAKSRTCLIQWCMRAKSFQFYLTLCNLWTLACQAPLSMGFSRQEYWRGLSCPSPGDLPHPGIEPVSLTSPALAGWFSTSSSICEAHNSSNNNIPLSHHHLQMWGTLKPALRYLWSSCFCSTPALVEMYICPTLLLEVTL